MADPNANPSNPLFLHSSENPALVLVTPLLNGRNYHSWSRAFRLALQSKNKIRLIDGSLKQPDPTDPQYDAWMRCNTMVLSLIQHSLEDSILKSILWIDVATEAWKDLKDRFSQVDVFRIAELQEEFFALSQGNLSISEFFTQLKTIWEEIDNARPIKGCKCTIPCTCGAIESVKLYREQDYTIRFLRGLNEQYAHVRSQFMLLDPMFICDLSNFQELNPSFIRNQSATLHISQCLGSHLHTVLILVLDQMI